MRRSKETIIENLRACLYDFFADEYRNKWIDCKDRPITRILLRYGLTASYSSSLIEVLQAVGSLQCQNVNNEVRLLKYYIEGSYIPDLDNLALRIYENYLSRKFRGEEFDGYPESNKSDLHPKRTYKRKETYKNTSIVSKREFHLLDKVFVLNENLIYEAQLIGMRFREGTIIYTYRYWKDNIYVEDETDKIFFYSRRSMQLSFKENL